MKPFRAAKHISTYYPKAIEASTLVAAFLWFARTALGVKVDEIALLTSICSDDLNSVQFLRGTKMIGPFILGGLDGYPFVGKTGLGAYSHHFPDGGTGLMFFGPHAGITDTGVLGKVVRPGQKVESDCCGAAAAALRKLEAHGITPKQPCDFSVDDYQQETLEQILLAKETYILPPGQSDDGLRFFRATEAIYTAMKGTMLTLLRGVTFEAPTFIFGGILINHDEGKEASIEIRDVLMAAHGQIEDVTHKFFTESEEKFKELEAGNADAFRTI